MGIEIERRFLVHDPTIIDGASRELIVQGYFFIKSGYAARVRRTHHIDERPWGDDHHGQREIPRSKGTATITVKGPRLSMVRSEYEMSVDPEFAERLLQEVEHKVSKSRYHIIAEGETWDVDVFHGDNDGLIIAECEMEQPRPIVKPSWCGEDVTGKPEYDNEHLAIRPFRAWEGGPST